MNEWNDVSQACVTGEGEGGATRGVKRRGCARAISHGKLNGQLSAHKAKSLRRVRRALGKPYLLL